MTAHTGSPLQEHGARQGLAFGAIYLIWGSTYLAIAFAIQSLPPLLMAGARFLIAGAVLYAWARLQRVPRPRPDQWGWAALLGVLFFLGGNGAVVWVEQHLPSGLTALIVALVSVWTALIDWLRPGGARPTGAILAGILLGFLGVGVLVVPGRVGGGHLAAGPVLLLVASTFGWALASVLSRTLPLPRSAPLVSGMEMLVGGTVLILVGTGLGEWARFDPAAVTLKSLLAFLYLVLFGSLVAFTAFAWLLQVTTPNKVATSGYVNPMVAVFLGWAFGGEALTLRSLAASLVIVASVILIVTSREMGAASRRASTPVSGTGEAVAEG